VIFLIDLFFFKVVEEVVEVAPAKPVAVVAPAVAGAKSVDKAKSRVSQAIDDDEQDDSVDVQPVQQAPPVAAITPKGNETEEKFQVSWF
jgi:hypothetical protein